MNKVAMSAVALASASLLAIAIATPAAAVSNSERRSCKLSGVTTGTLDMSRSTGGATSNENGIGGSSSDCGTVYVQDRYLAYVGGPSYLSPWVSNAHEAVYLAQNSYQSYHKATRMVGSTPLVLPCAPC